MYNAELKFHGSSGNKKIGKMANVNLLCGDDNLGGKTDVTGSCVGCCDSCKTKCYGRKSYRYPSAIKAHSDNTKFAREDIKGFFREAEKWCKKQKSEIVRIHPHGEVISKEYLKDWMQTARDIPEKSFYIYTKRYDWAEELLKEKPKNFVILLSPPFTCKSMKDVIEWRKTRKNLPVFIYDDGSDPEMKKMPHCPAVDAKGRKTGITCMECRRCPNGKSTAVYAH